MPFDFGIGEIAIVLVIGLLVFGPKRLPELSKSLGSGMRDLQRGMRGELDDEPKPAAAATAPAAAAAAAPVADAVVETAAAPTPAPTAAPAPVAVPAAAPAPEEPLAPLE